MEELTMEFIADTLEKKISKLRLNAEKLGGGDLKKGDEAMRDRYPVAYKKLVSEIENYARMYLQDRCFYFGFGSGPGVEEDMQEVKRVLETYKKPANTALFVHMDFAEYEEILQKIKEAVFIIWAESSKRITGEGGSQAA